MKFRIKGDKQKMIPLLETFVEETREEFDVQIKKIKNVPMLFGLSVPIAPFDIGLIEEEDSLILWNTTPVPKLLLKSFVGKRIKKKMKENLENYLKAKGLKNFTVELMLDE
jgi:hypothetical protein